MFKVFGSETLLSEDMNGIMRQTIIRVANAAELDALATVDVGGVAYVEADDTYYRRTVTTWAVWMRPDTDWVDLTLLNGWNAQSNRTPQVRRFSNKIEMQGQVVGGTSTLIANLPDGFMGPSMTHVVPNYNSDAPFFSVNGAGHILTATAGQHTSLVHSWVEQ